MMTKKTIRAALIGSCIMMSSMARAEMISEFQPNPFGTDPSTISIELSGTSGLSFAGWLLSIESDAGSTQGVVDRASQVSGTFDGNGLAVVTISDLENPSFTFAFVDSFTGSVGMDLDAANDGTIDLAGTGITTVYDAISVIDVGTDPQYGSVLGGVDFAFSGDEPKLMFRESSVGDWYAINDPAGTDAYNAAGSTVAFSRFSANPETETFGSINPHVIPEPATISLLGISGVALLIGSRRLKK